MKSTVAAIAATCLFAAVSQAKEPVSVKEFIPDALVDAKGESVDTKEALDGKVIGLYFSASWWGACKKSTSELVELRKAHGEDFEVVLVNFDKDQDGQNAYMKKSKMENLAFPHDEKKNEAIMKHVKAIGFPTLVLVSAEGDVLNHVIPMKPVVPVEGGKMRKDKVDPEMTLEKMIAAAIKAKGAKG